MLSVWKVKPLSEIDSTKEMIKSVHRETNLTKRIAYDACANEKYLVVELISLYRPPNHGVRNSLRSPFSQKLGCPVQC